MLDSQSVTPTWTASGRRRSQAVIFSSFLFSFAHLPRSWKSGFGPSSLWSNIAVMASNCQEWSRVNRDEGRQGPRTNHLFAKRKTSVKLKKKKKKESEFKPHMILFQRLTCVWGYKKCRISSTKARPCSCRRSCFLFVLPRSHPGQAWAAMYLPVAPSFRAPACPPRPPRDIRSACGIIRTAQARHGCERH